ncbi:MATE family efflux transporter [Flavobacterium palustre]|uniref:MATE family efflux transporter n=1 Tax=Flavobacterium palustre TaxID=1476463 RepID=UPI00360FA73F
MIWTRRAAPSVLPSASAPCWAWSSRPPDGSRARFAAAAGDPAEAFDLALVYLRVIFVAMPASLLSVMMMMGLRGTGDARTPLIFMFVSVGVDLVLNPVLILGLGPIPAMGIGGSAAATAAAGVVSLIGLVLYTYAKDLPLRLRGRELAYLRPAPDQMRVCSARGCRWDCR